MLDYKHLPFLLPWPDVYSQYVGRVYRKINYVSLYLTVILLYGNVLINSYICFKVNKVQLQCRAALITTVYEKALSVSSTSLSMFSSGQVMQK